MVTVTGDRPPGLSACLGPQKPRGPGMISRECHMTVYESNYYFPGTIKSQGGFIAGDVQERLAAGQG